jgi:molybdopterin synthase sulfur carrier subunit
VSGLREFLAGRTDVPVSRLAKWKTGVQMTALALLFGWSWADERSALLFHQLGPVDYIAMRSGEAPDGRFLVLTDLAAQVPALDRVRAAVDRGRADADHRLPVFPRGLRAAQGGVMRVLYFAWLRERIGASSEEVESAAATPRALVEELRAREPRYAAAFADLSSIRVAVDQEATDLDAPLAGAREVAFFPPVTGG